jgi:putative membrane protein
MALLTGFLFGSLAVVWPWKRVLEWMENRHGQLTPVQQIPVLPADFKLYSGEEPQLALCVALMVLGFVIVWFVHARWGHAPSHSH